MDPSSNWVIDTSYGFDLNLNLSNNLKSDDKIINDDEVSILLTIYLSHNPLILFGFLVFFIGVRLFEEW